MSEHKKLDEMLQHIADMRSIASLKPETGGPMRKVMEYMVYQMLHYQDLWESSDYHADRYRFSMSYALQALEKKSCITKAEKDLYFQCKKIGDRGAHVGQSTSSSELDDVYNCLIHVYVPKFLKQYPYPYGTNRRIFKPERDVKPLPDPVYPVKDEKPRKEEKPERDPSPLRDRKPIRAARPLPKVPSPSVSRPNTKPSEVPLISRVLISRRPKPPVPEKKDKKDQKEEVG